ncbi:MAG: hypothetical protein ABJA67_10495 [Chthonomonadales bacterium]
MPGLFAPEVGFAAAGIVIGAGGWLGYDTYRKSILRNWTAVAEKLGGTLVTDGPGNRWKIKGRLGDRPAFLQEDVSHEEAAAYHHTRGSLNIQNPAHLIIGLRHKSMLEEVVTQKDESGVTTGVAEFDRQFFFISNVPEMAATLFDQELQKELHRHSDLEIYLRSSSIEWRRSGKVKSSTEIMRLFDAIQRIAVLVGELEPRTLTADQRVAESELIAKTI